MNGKTLAVALFAAVLTVTIGMQPIHAQTVTGTAIIEPKTCGLIFTSNFINYGPLLNGQLSFGAPLNATYTNTGNSPGNVTIAATNWLNNTDGQVMGSYYTHISSSEITGQAAYDNALGLNGSADPLQNNFAASSSDTTFFALLVGLLDPSFTGNIHQDVTFETSCI